MEVWVREKERRELIERYKQEYNDTPSDLAEAQVNFVLDEIGIGTFGDEEVEEEGDRVDENVGK